MGVYQMICNKHDSLGKLGFDSSIGCLLDLVFHTLVAADDNGSRSKPVPSASSVAGATTALWW